MNNTNNEAMYGILAFIAGFILLFFILAIVLYILGSLGLMKIAKRKKEEYPAFAWIPFLNSYLSCKLSFKDKKLAIWYASLPPIIFILNIFFSIFLAIFARGEASVSSFLYITVVIKDIIFDIISFAIFIFNFVILYKIYKQFSDNATVMIVFTVLTAGLLGPIFLFAIRNNKLKEEIDEMDIVKTS